MRHGEYKTKGGKLVVVDFEVRHDRLTNVRVSGDFFVFPEEAVDAIVSALDGQSTKSTEKALAQTIRDRLPPNTEMLGFSPEAIAAAIGRALA